LIITFLISGLWHGAGWTFLIYGLLHGIAMSFEFLTKKRRLGISKKISKGLYNTISCILTFLFVSFAWVFFRAESFGKVRLIFETLFSFHLDFNLTQLSAEKGPLNLLLSFFVIGLFYFINKLYKSKWAFMFSLVTFFLIIILSKDGSQTFIYFQF